MSRPVCTLLHVDLDSFYAAVEQRDKPSLRGRPVVVGGTGRRGVVATASYEARVFGIHSAMSTAEAHRRCGSAAFLSPRFPAYTAASRVVMGILRAATPLVEPLSLDEAFLDLEAMDEPPTSTEQVRAVAQTLRDQVTAATGLTLSVGAATSKLIAKIASDLDKPDGLVVVPAGTETALLSPLPVTRLWGVGPATAQRLHRAGVHLVSELQALSRTDLVGLLGESLGNALWAQGRAQDTRAVQPHRESKSVSSEDTFAHDVRDAVEQRALLRGLASRTARRMVAEGVSGRTVTVKIRLGDFTTLSRSSTLDGPTDDDRTIADAAVRLLADADTSGGVRLLGVGVSNLTDWSQAALFGDDDPDRPPATGRTTQLPDLQDGEQQDEKPGAKESRPTPSPAAAAWRPGQDVVHASHGRGWVWGSGLGRVTVRFESRDTAPGPVRTLAADDPDLQATDPEPPLLSDAAPAHDWAEEPAQRSV